MLADMALVTSDVGMTVSQQGCLVLHTKQWGLILSCCNPETFFENVNFDFSLACP